MFKTLLTTALTLVTFVTVAQDTIKVGMSGRYYPFTFVQQDKLQGFEVDVFNEIGKRTDSKIDYVTASFSGLFGMMEAGHLDTIANQITITPERLKQYNFSSPYVIDGAQVVVRKGSSIRGIDDLKGKKVSVNLGSNFEQLLRKHDKNHEINIVTYDSGFEQDVALGRMDAFVMDRVSSLATIKKSGLPLELAGSPFEIIENAYPFAKTAKGEKTQQQVNNALAAMAEDGTLEKISFKWFNADITRK